MCKFIINIINFEEEFCNTIESLINQNKQIVITSDKPPGQLKLSERIVARMEALGPERDQWIEAFFVRLKTRGFNYDGDRLRQILDEEIPKKPDRLHRVVF